MRDAIYIPAYSDGLMSMFYSMDDDEIAAAVAAKFGLEKHQYQNFIK